MKKTKKIIAIMAAFMLATTSVFAGDAANDTEIRTEMTNESYTKTVMYGTFKSFEDGQVLLNDGKRDFAINTDENTLFVNSDAATFDITSAEKDTEFEIIADMAQTRSIPPQSYGYVVIAKTSEKSPIYVEAAEINDSEIVSADGEYIIRIPDAAEITAFGSGKTLTANEIKKDSKLFVYSDIMTMSIPAQVIADSIVVLDADTESNEQTDVKPGTIPGIKPGMSHEEIAKYIFRLIKLLGFENIFSK